MEIMEKTTLRIILAIAGILLLLLIYLWDRWKKRQRKLNSGMFSKAPDDFELEEIDTISINPIEESTAPDLEVLETEHILEEPEASVKEVLEEEETPLEAPTEEKSAPTPKEEKANLPEVIQISIVASKGHVFNGPDLAKAFADLGLKYGDMEIFHLYQGDRIQFSVASMVKPGTFPIDRMDTFQTPGLTLFMQPPLVSDPLQAFERMITLCHTLAQRLSGTELDDRRHPLTAVKLALWRRQLRGTG